MFTAHLLRYGDLMTSSIELLVTETYGRLLLACCELSAFPEIEEDAHRYAEGVRVRARERQLPILRRALPEFEQRVPALASRVAVRVHELSRPTLSRLHSVNDNDELPRCRTCTSSGREKELAERLGFVIAETLSAIHRRDPAALRHALDQFPSNFDEGHILPIGVLKLAIRKRASELALPKIIIQRMSAAIERIELASVQLCFDFAVAA